MGHCQLDPPGVEDWTNWAAKKGIDMRVIGFLQMRQGALFDFDGTLKEKAFATPRTWEFVSQILKDVPSDDISEITLRVATLVGEGKAVEFAGWLRLKDQLHPIKEYFDKPDKIDIPEDVNLLWCLVTSVVEYYKVHTDQKTLTSVVKLLKRVQEEYATFTLKLLYSIDNNVQTKLQNIPDAVDLAQKLWKFLQ